MKQEVKGVKIYQLLGTVGREDKTGGSTWKDQGPSVLLFRLYTFVRLLLQTPAYSSWREAGPERGGVLCAALSSFIVKTLL